MNHNQKPSLLIALQKHRENSQPITLSWIKQENRKEKN